MNPQTPREVSALTRLVPSRGQALAYRRSVPGAWRVYHLLAGLLPVRGGMTARGHSCKDLAHGLPWRAQGTSNGRLG